jgi:hypothetical protein
LIATCATFAATFAGAAAAAATLAAAAAALLPPTLELLSLMLGWEIHSKFCRIPQFI